MKNVIFKLIVPLLGIIAMLGFITFFQPIKQQNAAIVGNNGNVSCGNAGAMNLQFSDSCPSGNASLTSYQPNVAFRLQNDNRSRYFVDWAWYGFFCTAGNPSRCVPSNALSSNETSASHQVLTNAVVASTRMPNKQQFSVLACGAYQYDLAFAVYHFNGSQKVYDCAYGAQDPINRPGSALWCHTNLTCTAPPPPTATPTVPVTPPTATPTVPQQIQHMACQQNACRLVPGPGANQCTQNSECEAPTATPTVTSTPTVTVTEQPTATPTQPSSCTDTNNCNNNNNNNNNEQSQSQTQNNNQSVNITLNGGQQQVLAASTAPTQLPKTGAESDIIFGLLALIPVGWKLRKLV